MSHEELLTKRTHAVRDLRERIEASDWRSVVLGAIELMTLDVRLALKDYD